jgi:phosphohistidine phosphatase SixA
MDETAVSSFPTLWHRERMRRWIARVLLLIAMPLAAAADAAGWNALRQGAIVLLRHADAPGSGDPDTLKLGDCTTQRNLGETGRQQARTIGQRFTAERVPIGQVLSSEWCRTVETAELAFPGRSQPSATFNSFFNDQRHEPAQTQQARALLSAWSGPGTLVVITHQVNITALTGIAPAPGEGVVLRIANGTMNVVGRINP